MVFFILLFYYYYSLIKNNSTATSTATTATTTTTTFQKKNPFPTQILQTINWEAKKKGRPAKENTHTQRRRRRRQQQTTTTTTTTTTAKTNEQIFVSSCFQSVLSHYPLLYTPNPQKKTLGKQLYIP